MKKQQLGDEIFVIPNFLSSEECDQFIALSETQGYEDAKINVRGRQVLNKSVRNNERVLFKDYALCEQLWNRLKPLAPVGFLNWKPLGLNEMLRYYKYSPGQQFKPHLDGSYQRNEEEASFYTFMVYLNDDFEGGSTRFQELEVQPEKGTALIFWHRVLHEGAVLKSGTKYILRTDIMFRKDENIAN